MKLCSQLSDSPAESPSKAGCSFEAEGETATEIPLMSHRKSDRILGGESGGRGSNCESRRAPNIEGPIDYEPGYYAVFFEDHAAIGWRRAIARVSERLGTCPEIAYSFVVLTNE
jgi:hypothetical protein